MSAGAGRRAAGPAVAKVELRLSCRHLLDRDPLTKSDPSVLLLQPVTQGRWAQVGTGTGTGQGLVEAWGQHWDWVGDRNRDGDGAWTE